MTEESSDAELDDIDENSFGSASNNDTDDMTISEEANDTRMNDDLLVADANNSRNDPQNRKIFNLSRTSSSLSTISDIGNWLISVPRDDILALQNTPEYSKFLKAFEGLGHAHRRTIIHNRAAQALMLSSLSNSLSSPTSCNSSCPNNSQSTPQLSEIDYNSAMNHNSPNIPKPTYSFLQHLAVDDVVLRVFEFLECAALVRTSRTCHRFRDLALQSATQRTQDMEHSRVLNSSMKMLRAKEQMEGVAPLNGPFVRVPILSLPRRILVTLAGDEEYNGVYFCTGSNGNGFLFAKPRNVRLRSGCGRMLKCVIAKRYSNETILWYMSKEVENIQSPSSSMMDNMAAIQNNHNHNHNTIHNNNNNMNNHNNHNNNNININSNETQEQEISQMFSFWAKLMVKDEASLDICRYPSLTSILSRNDQPAWQPLSSTITFNPPVVELLD